MKILGIRGENLASLQDRFDLDLRDGPLGRAGLFAITGPTGAGKSTLLDAVSLCLYDKTPRLASSGGSALRLPGQDDPHALKTNDQRNILRRGAVAGWAEVDFRGRDGRVWTARWDVYRARRRATGRVQAQSVTLRDAQGQARGGTKTETLAAIEALVGLDFDQFRRSVLLAQGDFAAFLRANASDRAVLFDQMTGTEIYTRLSQAARQRAKSLHGQRLDLVARLDAQGVLSEDDRAAAEATLESASAARDVALAAVASAEAAVRWHHQAAELQAAVAAAREALQVAQAAWEAATPRQAALDLARRAWPLRDAHARLAALRRDATQRQAALQVSQQALTEAEATAARADTACRRADADHAVTCRALADQVQARLDRARQARQDAAAALTAHPDHRRLADPRFVRSIDDQLRRRQALAARRDDTRQDLDKARDALPASQAALDAAIATAREAADAVAGQEAGVAAAQAAAASHDTDALASQAATLDARQRALGGLATLAERAAALARKRTDADAARTRATKDAGDAQMQLATLTEQAAALGPRLAEAQAARDRARAAMDATELRRTLQAGQPCPVCGSEDHPWADGSPLAGLHADLQQRVADLAEDQRRLAAQQATAQAALAAAARDADAAADAQKQADEALAEVAERWRSQAPTAGLPEDLAPATAHGHLDAAQEALDAERQALAQRTDAARAASDALDRARQDLDSARRAASAATAAVATATQQRDAAAADVARLDATLQGLDAQHAELTTLLRDALTPADGAEAAVPDALDLLGDRAALVARLRQAGADWKRWDALVDRADAAISDLQARVGADAQRADAAGRDVAAEDLAAAQAPQPPRDLAPPDATDWLDAEVQHRAQRLVDATAARDAARQDLDGRRNDLAAAQGAAAQAADAAQRAARAAQDQATQLGIDADALDALLARPDTWLDDEARALRSLEDAPKQARTLLDERLARRQEHAKTTPDLDPDAANAAHRDATAARTAADDAWSAARATLQADDLARDRADDLRSQLATHDADAAPWLALDQCIGSASGDVFKRFAQSLTLDLLLEQANQHLHDLYPRYSLARIGGTDLDLLVVDHDLGDEPRTVQSLSGGESFLTSLALALALSSLSSRDVRIESLFIDEGFGTLDAQTLDTALSVLDSLQAAGRQVGIISHVGGLAERIGVQVRIDPQGGGRSTVSVVEC